MLEIQTLPLKSWTKHDQTIMSSIFVNCVVLLSINALWLFKRSWTSFASSLKELQLHPPSQHQDKRCDKKIQKYVSRPTFSICPSHSSSSSALLPASASTSSASAGSVQRPFLEVLGDGKSMENPWKFEIEAVKPITFAANQIHQILRFLTP